jgi:hypothetical protein
VRCQQK